MKLLENLAPPTLRPICGLDGQYLLLPLDLDSLGIDVLRHLKHLLLNTRRGAGELRILLEDKVLEPMRTLRDQGGLGWVLMVLIEVLHWSLLCL